jgi:nicotinamidase-related amidase
MTSAPVRDPLAGHLLTPDNAALLLIGYQPVQLAGARSMDRMLLVKNAVSTVKTIKTFEVPVLHSTVNVASDREQPTRPTSPAVWAVLGNDFPVATRLRS